MKYVKYTSVGLSLSGRAGKVSYLHINCHAAMNTTTAGPKGEEIDGIPPAGANCVWCGKPIEELRESIIILRCDGRGRVKGCGHRWVERVFLPMVVSAFVARLRGGSVCPRCGVKKGVAMLLGEQYRQAYRELLGKEPPELAPFEVKEDGSGDKAPLKPSSGP